MGEKHILIADNDPMVLFTLQEIILTMPQNHQIETFADGTAALERIKHTVFDLVVLDMVMPGLTGLEVVQEMRSLGIDTAVIWITGHGCHELKKNCVQLNVFDCLEKPLKVEVIRLCVSQALEAGMED